MDRRSAINLMSHLPRQQANRLEGKQWNSFNFVNFIRFFPFFFSISIIQVDLTLSDSDEDDCVVGQSAGNNNTNIGPNKGPSATPVITNGRSR